MERRDAGALLLQGQGASDDAGKGRCKPRCSMASEKLRDCFEFVLATHANESSDRGGLRANDRIFPMPNPSPAAQRNGAAEPLANPFVHSRRRIESDEVTIDTIAGSLLRIFVRIEKLDAAIEHLEHRIVDLEARYRTFVAHNSSTPAITTTDAGPQKVV
jgi:hypothetical protein